MLGQPIQKKHCQARATLRRAHRGRIGANDDTPEHLSTFHHNTFFTRFFIIENVYNTSFRIQYGRMF
jgi:hypothetical protein